MSLDFRLSLAMAEFVQAHPTFLKACELLGSTYSFKTLPVIVLLVAIWFSGKAGARRIVASGIAATFVALVVSRLIQNLGPHRPRPAYLEELPFSGSAVPPPDWSSFPSDTAALLGALVATAWIARRPYGIIAFVWAIVALTASKFVMGAHFASDLVAGFALGVGISWLCCRASVRFAPAFDRFELFFRQHQGIFYAGAFIVVFQLSTMFADVRRTASAALKTVGILREEEPPAKMDMVIAAEPDPAPEIAQTRR